MTMKRFYKKTSWRSEGEAGFSVYLDERELRAANKRMLRLPSQMLAQAIAGEWADQEDEVDPASMPMTAYAFTALDVVADKQHAIQAEVSRYAETDLLCYIAAEPEALAARLAANWQPILDWAAKNLDAPLVTTSGLMAIAQPADSLAALRRRVVALDLFELTAIQTITAILGSLVLALAIIEGRLTVDQAFDLARLEETFQAEQWGLDEEDEVKQAKDREEVCQGANFLQIARV